jgi:hypothetical protein
MLSKADKDKLKALGFDPDKLEAAAKADAETPIEVPAGQFFTEDELKARDTATQKEGYNSGKAAGEEMLVDKIKKDEGLQFEGKKVDKLIPALKAKYEDEKGKDVDQKVKDRDARITALTESLNQASGKLETISTEYSGYKADMELLTALPQNRNSSLTQQEWIFRLKQNGVKLEEVEGKKVVRINGDIVLNDKDKKPLPVDTALENLFKSKEGWLAQPQQQQQRKGPGGKDDNPPRQGAVGIFKTLKDFNEEMASKNVSYTSQDYQVELQAAVKANPEMDMTA